MRVRGDEDAKLGVLGAAEPRQEEHRGNRGNFLFLALFLRGLVAPLYLLAASVLGLVALGVTTIMFHELLGYGDITYYVPFAGAVLLLCSSSAGSGRSRLVDRRATRSGWRRPGPRARSRSPASRSQGASPCSRSCRCGFRELALIMAVGVLIDTFLVHTLLVPSLIALRPHAAGHG